jgi:TAG lipase/lysophosphatidylethanolamine acyltransferase
MTEAAMKSLVVLSFMFLINHTPSFLWVLIDFITDIVMFWITKVYNIYNRKDRLKESLKQLSNVTTYREWKEVVTEIDRLTNMDFWRQNFISKHYDYVLISERLKALREARMNDDSTQIMSLLRAGMIRNFGGIAQKRLYLKSYLGTKYMIDDFIGEVLECLSYLNDSMTSVEANDHFISNSKQLKLDFFHDARQSFGCTALLLQGGSLFGLCHLGVVKALYFKGLLPRIIAGSAVGAAVASLVCTLRDHELIPILLNIAEVIGDVDRLNHDVDERYGNVIENVVKKGYSQDILIFLKFVRDTIGDLTFEEAYLRTEKVLNIVVHPTNQAIPSLMNYITAPNVIIWTAIYASIGTGVLSDNVRLYVKDFNNNIVPQLPGVDVTFLKPQDVSYQQQYFRKGDQHIWSSQLKEHSPYTRLTELFNVNHFVISLARPYLAPLLSNDLKHYRESVYQPKITPESKTFKPSKLEVEKYTNDSGYNLKKHIKNVIGLEIEHRLVVMNKMGILTDVMKRFFIDEKPGSLQTLKSIREITIVPELKYLMKDFGRVFDVHKTMENIPYWVLVGERSVWPLFPLLWTRCSIEFALDDLYNIHRKRG